MRSLQRRRAALTLLCLVAVAVAAVRAADYVPARRIAGDVPNPPLNAIGWVEAVVDLELDANGGIMSATGLRATPGGLNFVLPSLKNWKFRPANDGEGAVASHVLVAAMFRPAQLFDPAGGKPTEKLKDPVNDLPFPLSMVRPAYPQNVVGNRSVLVEVLIGADGRTDEATIVGTTSGWDAAALTAASGWTFRAPRAKDKDGTVKAVPGVAYLIFGFRMPA
jgi:hypothetical protein